MLKNLIKPVENWCFWTPNLGSLGPPGSPIRAGLRDLFFYTDCFLYRYKKLFHFLKESLRKVGGPLHFLKDSLRNLVCFRIHLANWGGPPQIRGPPPPLPGLPMCKLAMCRQMRAPPLDVPLFRNQVQGINDQPFQHLRYIDSQLK